MKWPLKSSHKHRSKKSAEVAESSLGHWTNGSSLKTKAATVLLVGALVLSPAGLVVGLAAASSGSAPVTETQTADTRGEQAAVEEFAARFVTTWLVANADNAEDLLVGLVEIPDSAEFPSTGLQASDPTVAGVEQLEGGIWSVTIAVTTVDPAASAPGVRRFFRVPVVYDTGRLVALALPAPTAAPTMAETPDLGYPSDLSTGHPAWRTVGGFMTALLAGKGDITRYLTPGTRVAPVVPVPFGAIRINQIAASVDVGEEPAHVPADGQQLPVLVTVSGLTSATASSGLTVQYALVLTGRDGRWEVTEVEASPHVEVGVGDVSGEPSADGSPAEEEE
ncbi:MAG TPA: conjugal transfer protein [Nocardioidaceae bacterium]|nr:conjugal transfer protein [Nocardioidaceae bacterium]